MTQVESARYDRAVPALEVLSARKAIAEFPGGAHRLPARKRGRANRARAARELSAGLAKLARVHGRHPVTYSEKRASSENPSDDDASLDFARELR